MKAYKNSRIAILLILSMVAAVWSGRAGSAGSIREKQQAEEPVTEITEVWIGIKTPAVDQALPDTATVETVSVESGTVETVSVEKVNWLHESGNEVGDNEKAESGKSYTCLIILKAKDGYKFKDKDNLGVYFNGNKEFKATVNKYEDDRKVVYVEYGFKVDGSGTSPSPSAGPTGTPVQTTKPNETDKPTSSPSAGSTGTPVQTTKPNETDKPTSSPTAEPTPAVPDTETPDVQKPSATWPGDVFLPSPSPAVYMITLDANKGTVPDADKKKVTKRLIPFTAAQMDTIKLPVPVRKGYVFIGWYSGKTRVEKIREAKDISLKALWMKDTFTYPNFNFKKNLDSKLKWNVTVNSIEKKYKKNVKINKKKGTIKGKKYFKKANVVLKIDGKKISVTVKAKLPKPKIVPMPGKKLQYYVSGAYRRYALKYTYVKAGATRAVAEYSFKKGKGYKKCGKYQNMLKGARASVKKGKKVYFRVRIYYGKYSSPPSAPKLLKG